MNPQDSLNNYNLEEQYPDSQQLAQRYLEDARNKRHNYQQRIISYYQLGELINNNRSLRPQIPKAGRHMADRYYWLLRYFPAAALYLSFAPSTVYRLKRSQVQHITEEAQQRLTEIRPQLNATAEAPQLSEIDTEISNYQPDISPPPYRAEMPQLEPEQAIPQATPDRPWIIFTLTEAGTLFYYYSFDGINVSYLGTY